MGVSSCVIELSPNVLIQNGEFLLLWWGGLEVLLLVLLQFTRVHTTCSAGKSQMASPRVRGWLAVALGRLDGNGGRREAFQEDRKLQTEAPR